MDKPRLEQREGEEFIAVLNAVAWPIRTRGGDCNGYVFKLF